GCRARAPRLAVIPPGVRCAPRPVIATRLYDRISPLPSQAEERTTDTSPAGLSRDKVLEAALRLIDEHGLAALSMRRLASDLGVEAMSLYHHVRNKADLLD